MCWRCFLSPRWGLLIVCCRYPRLAPWAALFRRFAAAHRWRCLQRSVFVIVRTGSIHVPRWATHNSVTDVTSSRFSVPIRHQTGKLTHFSTSPLRSSAFICYKQFTESSVWQPGVFFCNSRRRPASKIIEPDCKPALNRPGHGTSIRKLPRFLKGTFKARTSKSKIFSQFSVFRLGMRRKSASFKTKRKAILVARLSSQSRFLALMPLGMQVLVSSSWAEFPMWKSRGNAVGCAIDRVFRRTVCL